MVGKLRQLAVYLRSNFWFLPAMMMLGAAVLAVALVDADANLGWDLVGRFPRVFGANAEGARNILSTVASSMISIAGLTFSITIVTLSLASAQYTSRILRNFMRDRANQTVLGVYLSIYVYCLIVLRSIRGGEEAFVPSLSIGTGIILGIVGIAFLIFFIHHTATSIQASTIISRIAAETVQVVDEMYPDKHDKDEPADESERCRQMHSWVDVPARVDGYIQTADYGRLIAWAEKRRTMVRMTRGIGEFATAGASLVQVPQGVTLSEEEREELDAGFSRAPYRTIEQDVAFGIRQLVDVALKALSPGVNDTTTAVTCVHYLGAILRRVSERRIPAEVCRVDGEIRLIRRSHTFDFLVGEMLHQIRQEARANVAVLLAMIDAIEAAQPAGMSAGRRALLQLHSQRILLVATRNITDSGDLKAVSERVAGLARR